MSTLCEDDIRRIRVQYAAGNVSQTSIARTFGVAQTTISQIVRGRTWTHVDAHEIENVSQ
jgi:plasmid maintenance system antidote protein VapI